MEEVNNTIKNFSEHKNNTSFADVYHEMLKRNGSFRGDYFLEDKLHMNSKGYPIWQETIKPYLLKD